MIEDESVIGSRPASRIQSPNRISLGALADSKTAAAQATVVIRRYHSLTAKLGVLSVMAIYRQSKPIPGLSFRGGLNRLFHSGSVGSLNRTVSFMLPCPNWGKFGVVRTPGSRVEAVSSGGKRTRESRNFSTAADSDPDSLA